MRAAVAVALAGSLWSAFGATRCTSCDGAGGGSRALAVAGATWYLLLLATPRAPRPLWTCAVSATAGVHLALIGLLIAQRRPCPPCLLTAAAALVAAAIVLADRTRRTVHSLALVGAAATAALAIWLSGAARPPAPTETEPARIVARTATREVLRGFRHRAGDVPRVVVFTMDGCQRCRDFEAGVLADAQRRLPGRFTVAHRLPPQGMHVPVVLVLGAERFLFFDPPDAQDLGRALDRAAGGAGLPPRTAARP